MNFHLKSEEPSSPILARQSQFSTHSYITYFFTGEMFISKISIKIADTPTQTVMPAMSSLSIPNSVPSEKCTDSGRKLVLKTPLMAQFLPYSPALPISFGHLLPEIHARTCNLFHFPDTAVPSHRTQLLTNAAFLFLIHECCLSISTSFSRGSTLIQTRTDSPVTIYSTAYFTRNRI